MATLAHRGPTEFLAEWAQVNWEMVVEAVVARTDKVFIDPYGDGADCNGASSRIWMPDAASTHVVSVVYRRADV